MSEAAATPADGNVFQTLDDSKINKFQIKTMFVAGMGFFTDAYDLFVIGIVVSLLKTQWNLSTGQVSWLNSATLLASAFGAIAFGRVADILGRKRIYGYEVLILAIGAIASALAPNYTFLLVSRIVLGVGIGGDYPVSATIMSEYSGKGSRGKMVGLVFAMQGLGLVVGPLIASILLASGISENLTWRILLGLGAIPGLAVFYLRRQIHETPRFALAGGAHEEAAAAIADATGQASGVRPAAESTARHPQSVAEGFLNLLHNRRMFIWLIGTAGAWMLLDFLYGISYFFTEFGPNMTTFIYPAELFPTEVRTTGHGISAGAGKLGAFIGAFLFPTILDSSIGLRGAMVICGIVAAAGLLLTFFTLPETRGKTLEELEADAHAPSPSKLRAQPEPA